MNIKISKPKGEVKESNNGHVTAIEDITSLLSVLNQLDLDFQNEFEIEIRQDEMQWMNSELFVHYKKIVRRFARTKDGWKLDPHFVFELENLTDI